MLWNPIRLAPIAVVFLFSFSCAGPVPAVPDSSSADARTLSVTSPVSFDTKSAACGWARDRVRRTAARDCKLAAYSAPTESCECDSTGGSWSCSLEAAYMCQ